MYTLLIAKLISALTILAVWLNPADFYQMFINRVSAAASVSPDAIALRVMPNPEYLSSADWYKANIKTQGSPQAVVVDGFEGIRDGRTVYVNAANIDLANNKFYDNIYLLSFNQNAEPATEDIFGQLLSQWKFNTNIMSETQKDKIRNDTKRLADLTKIRLALKNYKDSRGNYPKLSSGSYLAGKTISVWPSYQATLGKELGLSLPVDPVNKLGPCPSGYDAITCWNQTDKKFATDLNQPVFPTGSRVYFYSVDAKGENIKVCGQLETNYANLASFNCFVDQLPNSAPVIKAANLTGLPMQKFTGYISVSDPDDDNLSYAMELVEPAGGSAKWASDYLWQWDAGAGFTIKTSVVAGQIIISAAKAGRASSPGMYKVKFTVNDGKHQPNSVVSKIFEAQIKPYPMELSSLTKDIVIGENKSFTLIGLDNSKQPIANLSLINFLLNGSAADMATHGFSLSGASLSEQVTAAQKTGQYKANVRAVDATFGNTIDSFFQINVTNHPPALNTIQANYANGKNCVLGAAGCSQDFIIDNGEEATIKISASDPDSGHIVNYELVDNFSGALSINTATGLISGLEKLNYKNQDEKIFTVKVRAFDQYCAQSSSAECSIEASFNVKVDKYCSLDILSSTQEANLLSTPYKIDVSGQKINFGSSLPSCSTIGNSRVDIKYTGPKRSQVIVFVLDLSKSMDANVGDPPAPAVNQLKKALTEDDGVFKKLYDAGLKLNSFGSFLKVGLIGYNSGVDLYNPVNIADSGELNNIKEEVNNYSTDYETDTLKALNEAEKMLATVTGADIDKYIVLMSDGTPAVTQKTSSGTCCVEYKPACPCASETWPNCHTCQSDETPICSPPWCVPAGCPCGGQPPCTYPTCPCGRSGCNCISPCGSSFNSDSLFRIVLNNIFGIKSALAITYQTQCISGDSCGSCVYPKYNSCCKTTTAYDCDISDDVNNEATAMKNSGIKFYSIYYDTTNEPEAGGKMCRWSNNEGLNCDNDTYSFSGTDISLMFNKVIENIGQKPKSVKIEDLVINDNHPLDIVSQDVDVNIDKALQCGRTELDVIFSGLGYLEFSNLRINYCPLKLHP